MYGVEPRLQGDASHRQVADGRQSRREVYPYASETLVERNVRTVLFAQQAVDDAFGQQQLLGSGITGDGRLKILYHMDLNFRELADD